MELELEIINLRSKLQVEKLIRWVGTNTKRFAQLMNLFLNGDQDISRRSAWIIGHCCERKPELSKPWLKVMIKKMQEPNVHSAIQRCVMRVLQYVEIPRSLKGTVVNLCFNFISDTKTAIAPQAFSMTVLSNIAKKEPDLMKELRVLIRQMLPYGTPAFRARAKKIFKNLDLSEKDAVFNKSEEDKLLHDWLMKKE
jgi:hypothetical protein